MNDNQKKIFSLALAATLTLIIVVVWFSLGEKSTNEALIKENRLSSISPIQVIKEEFSKAFSGFSASVADINSSSTDNISTSSISIETIEESTSTASTTNI
jgi:hypothetical protein